MRLVYFLSDLAAFLGSLGIAHAAVALLFPSGSTLTASALRLDLLWLVGLVGAAAVQQTYAAIPPRPVRKFRGWVLGVLTVCVSVVGGGALLGAGTWPVYASLVTASILAVLSASFCRAICRIVFGSAAWWGTRLLVLGSGDLAEQTYAQLAREPQWGLRPVGFVDDEALIVRDESPAYLGPLADLDILAEKYRVKWAILAVHSLDAEELGHVLSRGSRQIAHWIILPPLERFPSMWLEACEAARRPALALTNRLMQPSALLLKRAFDLAATALLSVVAVPLVMVIAALIRLSSPGPILYAHERVGRLGRRFTAWKFRTMFPDADAVLERFLEAHPELAEEWQAKHKLCHDPRVTWIGRLLRSTSLDELPQLWNVVRGEMSLVGPRPIVEAEIEKYGDHYEDYVQVLPGITGMWQVSGRNNTTYAERVALDVYYVQNWSVWLDVYILACTAKVVLLCEGAY
jgi:Undecaprenyl-phosphate galactose phosphotransferase WbaP